MNPHSCPHLTGSDWWSSVYINAGSHITTQRDSKKIKISEVRVIAGNFTWEVGVVQVSYGRRDCISGSTKKQRQ